MTSVPKHDPETNKNPADHSGYKIGYSKPPLDSRWRKGQCPNRKGRGPRKGGEMESYGDLVVRNSNEKITIYENGTERCVPKRVHLATRVVNRGIAGDPEEEKILIKFERPDLRPPAGARHIVDVDSEDEIPARTRIAA